MSLFFVRDCLLRAIERKKTLLMFAALFLLSAVLGLCFVNRPAVYYYHINLCGRYVDRVCFSDANVFLIFLKRTAGHALLLLLIVAGGIHPATVVLSASVLVYRAYTFGGSLYILFSVYGMTGALIALILYLPIHMLIDGVFLLGCSLSCGRARCFSRGNLLELLYDFLVLLALIALICLLEMILLLALFHPIGNIL